MNKIFVFLVVIDMGLTAHAELYQMEGTPFQPATNTEIVWLVTATNVPKNLWVYKVIPQTFSMAVLSNLLTLCDLKTVNMTKTPNLDVADKDEILFLTQRPNGTFIHSLKVAPSFGWIHYQNTSDETIRTGQAPTSEIVKELAFDLLHQAGIDSSLVSFRRYSESISKYGTNPSFISARTVSFTRKIEGLNESSYSFRASYTTHKENNEKPLLLSFELNWRNLLPYKSCRVATEREINEFILSGKATIPLQNMQNIDLDALKLATKYTVTTFFPTYYNATGITQVDFEYPFAAVDIVATCPDGKSLSFTMNCPILEPIDFY